MDKVPEDPVVQAKAHLIYSIWNLMKARDLSYLEAGKAMGIAPQDVIALLAEPPTDAEFIKLLGMLVSLEMNTNPEVKEMVK